MEPLRQWICDVCGELIESPEDGYLVWKTDKDGLISQMRILHHTNLSKRPTTICDYDRTFYFSAPLTNFIGTEGMIRCLSLFDPGPDFTHEFKPQVSNVRLFLEIYRRLQIPYYEEARLYWTLAKNDGFFDGMNEYVRYLPETLQEIIKLYGDQKRF